MKIQNRPRKKQISCRPFTASQKGVCCQCPAGCGLMVFQGEGADPVDIFGDEMHPVNKGALCPRSLALYAQLHHSSRLLRPAVRSSVAEPWHETDWDTALEAAAGLIRSVRADKLLITADESDPFEYVSGAEMAASLLKLPVAPTDFFASAFGEAGALKDVLGIPADQCLSNSPRDWCASKVIVMVGGDLAAENPVTFGLMQDARDRGAKLLYIGSRGGMTARRSSEAWLVRPGTESTLLAAVIAYLIDRKAIDEEFIAQNVSGVEDLAGRLAGYTPECAAEVCGISEKSIISLAELLGGADPIQVVTGQVGHRRWIDDSVITLCCALVALKGCFGKPGGGLNVLGTSPFVRKHNVPTTLALEVNRRHPDVLIGCGNPLHRVAGQANREAFRRIRNIIHIGCYDNETRASAVVSLPLAHWTECDGLVERTNGRALQWREAVLKPLGQSLPPLQIWNRLLRLLNKKTSVFESESLLADAACAANPLTAGIRVTDLKSDESGGMLWPCSKGAGEADKTYEVTRYVKGNVHGKNNILFGKYSTWADGETRFPTLDGRIHLEHVVTASVAAVGRAQGVRLVVSDLVDRAFDHPQDVLWPNGDLGTAVRVNLQTAAKLNLESGSDVVVSSDFGSVRTKIVTGPDIPDDIAVLPPENGLALIEDALVLRPVCVTIEKIAGGK